MCFSCHKHNLSCYTKKIYSSCPSSSKSCETVGVKPVRSTWQIQRPHRFTSSICYPPAYRQEHKSGGFGFLSMEVLQKIGTLSGKLTPPTPQPSLTPPHSPPTDVCVGAILFQGRWKKWLNIWLCPGGGGGGLRLGYAWGLGGGYRGVGDSLVAAIACDHALRLKKVAKEFFLGDSTRHPPHPNPCTHPAAFDDFWEGR